MFAALYMLNCHFSRPSNWEFETNVTTHDLSSYELFMGSDLTHRDTDTELFGIGDRDRNVTGNSRYLGTHPDHACLLAAVPGRIRPRHSCPSWMNPENSRMVVRGQ